MSLWGNTLPAKHLVGRKWLSELHYNMSLRGATVLVATWQSRGSAIVKKILSLARLFLVSVPPTCLQYIACVTNRYPDRPPLKVKGLYCKVAVKSGNIKNKSNCSKSIGASARLPRCYKVSRASQWHWRILVAKTAFQIRKYILRL